MQIELTQCEYATNTIISLLTLVSSAALIKVGSFSVMYGFDSIDTASDFAERLKVLNIGCVPRFTPRKEQ